MRKAILEFRGSDGFGPDQEKLIEALMADGLSYEDANVVLEEELNRELGDDEVRD